MKLKVKTNETKMIISLKINLKKMPKRLFKLIKKTIVVTGIYIVISLL